MRTWLLFLFTLSICSEAFAGRIILNKDTGEYGEYQSHAMDGTLLENARLAGLDISKLEEREISEEEFAQINKERADKASAKILSDKEAEISPKRDALKLKLGLTDDDISTLRKIILQ